MTDTREDARSTSANTDLAGKLQGIARGMRTRTKGLRPLRRSESQSVMATVSNKSDRMFPVPFVDLGPSSAVVSDAILANIKELMEAGSFVNGPYVDAFEREFAEACGRQEAVGVASGLDALRLGLTACGLEGGDEVIVPAMTFAATFEAVVQAGGRIVVVDVREDDAGMDMDAAAAVVGPATRFVMRWTCGCGAARKN